MNVTNETFILDLSTSADLLKENESITLHHQEVIILAPFLLLGLGAFLRHSTKTLPIPYTMQLLVVGMLLGLLIRQDRWNNALQQSIQSLGNMDPHLMLHIFLPPLIFESAASLEWHLVEREKWYILALAGPGLVLSSALTAFVLKYIMDRSETFTNGLVASFCPENAWSFQAAFMLGVIMSATDPVAVVALLKELGCKASLSIGIEGESLLNDGTALVLFTILVKIVQGDDSDGWDDYVWTFARMSIGGAVYGGLFALIVVRWLRVIFNDALAEITITLSAAYLCFFTAEYYLQLSGVIAVVCLGLYFGNSGRTSVSPEVAHFLEEFWEMLAFFGNTLIFVVAGAVIGYKFPSVPMKDFLQLPVMYVTCTLIRMFVVSMTFILFRYCGIKLEKKDQVITIFAGLRGAVGLSLAMMVFGDPRICQPIREIVIFQTAGIVVLTVCINSLIMPKLVSLLGLDSIAPSKELIYNQAMISLLKAGRSQEGFLRSDHLFDGVSWETSRKYYFQVDLCKLELERESLLQKNTSFLEAKEARRRILMIIKKSYWRQFQEGLLSHHAVKYLVHHTDLAIDDECSLHEFKVYIQLIRLSSTIDKGTNKLVPSEGSSDSERRKLYILNFLDSVPVIILILVLVFTSCILTFTLDNLSQAYLIIDNTMTLVFCTELCARIYCVQDWQAFAVDPYLAIDILTVVLDIILFSVSDLLGSFSGYSKSLRTFRFLRLIRLLRLAKVANRLKRAKIAVMNEPTSLWEKTESYAKKYQRKLLYLQLKHGYEIAIAFKVAREEALLAIEHIRCNESYIGSIEQGILKDLKEVRTAILDVQRLCGEISASITTALAARTVLNKQRHKIQDLYHEGFLDINEYKKLTGRVEYQMKTLLLHPPIIPMPNKRDILRQIPWLECLNKEELSTVSFYFEDAIFQRGDILVRQDDTTDSVHVLARGTVVVTHESSSGDMVEIDELGFGSVFGEIAWGLKCTRGASIVATSPGLLFTIQGDILRRLAKSNEHLEIQLWETCGRRLSENLLSTMLENGGDSRQKIREIVQEMTLFRINPADKKICFNNSGFVVMLQGIAVLAKNSPSADNNNVVVQAPKILFAKDETRKETHIVDFSTDSIFMCNQSTIGKHREERAQWLRRVSKVDLEVKRSNAYNTQFDAKELEEDNLTSFRRSSISDQLSHSNKNHDLISAENHRRKTINVSSLSKGGKKVENSDHHFSRKWEKSCETTKGDPINDASRKGILFSKEDRKNTYNVV